MPEVRLIDANALFLKQKSHVDLFKCSGIHDDVIRSDEATMALAEILNAPTIEAEPVRHGRWVFVGEVTAHDGWTYRKYKCSECNFSTIEAVYFCQKCGARMEGGADNG